MVAMESLWDFEVFTPDAGPVDKDAGAAQATANGPAPNHKSPNGASLNGCTPKSAESENSPEAFLSNGQIRDVFQKERGITVRTDRARDDPLTEFGKSTLSDRLPINGGCLGDSKGAAKG